MFLLCLIANTMSADSPLTSTDFYKAYESEPIVLAAARARGTLTKQIMDYLSDSEKPIDIKVAAINRLGWDVSGKSNASIFLNFMKEIQQLHKYGDSIIGTVNRDSLLSADEEVISHLNSDELLCYAYLKAMDNYFAVDEALSLAERAVQMKPDSYTYCIIAALIQAQKLMESDGCEVYNVCNYVRMDTSLKSDMKTEAIDIIFGYVDLYKCNK